MEIDRKENKEGKKVPQRKEHTSTDYDNYNYTNYINFMVRDGESARVAHWKEQLSEKQWPPQASGFDTSNGENPGPSASNSKNLVVGEKNDR